MRAPVSLEANRDPLAQVQNDDAVLVLGGRRFGMHSEFHFVRHHGPRIGRNAARNNTERSLFFSSTIAGSAPYRKGVDCGVPNGAIRRYSSAVMRGPTAKRLWTGLEGWLGGGDMDAKGG